ncbi:sensor domain-containing diguanylate cyclase [Xanthomonas melonis]|uniref:sensor domain-containing diguanylate cyclase n=1 Tax=Xanthomonas melonis TaxID=56456 RepID=UPI001E31A0AD|nr:sensor domain-containing diguanylate cyclase [Xanthomonas melonis]MCD0278950.1 sensor domain-containing diguanylate cyclase [Xanthomonas melonis]
MQTPDAPALTLIQTTPLVSELAPYRGAPRPANEDERVAALHATALLDTAPEPRYDALTASAAAACGTPMALISLVDTQRQWFKSRRGMQASETPRTLSFCAHAILAPDQLMEVADTQLDARFVDNALVTGEPRIRFYAGAPLLNSDGIALGTLCVLDHAPRRLSDAERAALRTLARQVVHTIELQEAASLVALDALRDHSTGLWNRAGLEQAVQALLHDADAPSTQALGLVLIDLDGFKRQKLQAGAAAAQATVMQAARLLEARLPPRAIVAQLSGDRFCVVLPATPAGDVLGAVEDLRQTIQDAHWPTGALTISAGVVAATLGDAGETNTLLARARHALQKAIAAGRDRVHCFSGWQLHD